MNLVLKETVELAEENIEDKLVNEKHELGTCPENKLFNEYILLDEEEEQDFDTEVTEADNYTEEGLENLICVNITL